MAKLYCRENLVEAEIPQLDRDIRRYIEENQSEDYDSVIGNDSRWEVFLHLSQMRTSLVNWYEFNEGSTLLEIGGGFGALTGVFCDRCGSVTVLESSPYRAEAICKRYENRKNLSVYVETLESFQTSEKFDYIVLVGGLENIARAGMLAKDYSVYLKRLEAWLKPDGKLLLAVDNRYGLRYFCGTPERHTGKPFRGLNQYPDSPLGRAFARQELISILEAAGFSYHKFYYPLPDYVVPQLIYSEAYLPQKDVCERLVFYYEDTASLVVDERLLYEDIIENQVFEFFANSFFVECGWDKGCSVIYGALTTDRGPKCALATTIHDNDTVKKKALYSAGIKSVRSVYENIQELEQRGIHVVPHRWEDRGVAMPFVKSATFSDYLRSIVKEKPNLFEELLDRLYSQILMSSDRAPDEENALLEGADKHIDFGPILKKAYIDMVPFNCFYINNEFAFFDQEFSRTNFPAKYVLFRALKYTYLSIPFAEEYVPLGKLIGKYHMEELWPIFTKEEDRFVGGNRRYDIYRNFYSRTWVDRQQIYDNGDRLLKGTF